jgi:hypothetical protein
MRFCSPVAAFLLAICLGPSLLAQDLGLRPSAPLTILRPLPTVDELALEFPLKFSIFGSIGYDDNVDASSDDRQGSFYNTFGLNIATNMGDERTRLIGSLFLGAEYYWDRPGSDSVDPNTTLNLTFTHSFTQRLVLEISAFLTYQLQSSEEIGVGTPEIVGRYVFSNTRFSLGYQWTQRFSTVTSYTLGGYFYEESLVADEQNRLEHLFAQEFRLQLLPTISAVADYRFGYIDYFDAELDSLSHYGLLGADVTLSPRLRFILRAGAEFRDFVGTAYTQSSAVYPYFESTLTYQFGPNSFLQWLSRYSIEEGNAAETDVGRTADFPQTAEFRRTFRTGLQASHKFSQRFQGAAGVYYSNNDYDGTPSFTENIVELNVGLSYQLTRALGLNASYTFTNVSSEMAGRDYYRNRVTLGATFTF